MSQRVEQILEIIEEVREKFQSGKSYGSVSRLRVAAVSSVAKRRGVSKQTILDKFIRQLRPDVYVAADFDKLLEKWLGHDSDELRNIILKHKSDYKGLELINNAFYKAPEPDIPLAHEFGFDPNEQAFKEGKEQLQLHLTKERNRHLVIRAKSTWLEHHNGQVWCFICQFSFPEKYGNVGEGFIEAHHMKPISTLTPDTIVTVADLIPVCSNCHSMLHRHRPWLSAEELKNIVSKQSLS
jgi:hypothetical protein